MIIDTSALAAIFFEEPESEHFRELIHGADRCAMSAANFVELSIVLEAELGSEAIRHCDTFFRRVASPFSR